MLPFSIAIDVDFPTFNNYINAERRNRYVASKLKKEYTNIAKIFFLKYKNMKLEFPIQINFTWYAKTSARDIDGFSFAKKCILDGMKDAGLVPDDNIKFIRRTIDDVIVAKKDGVIMEIVPYKEK